MAFQTQAPCVNRAGAETRAVEAWLRQSLGQRFDDTLYEPLPNDLLALLGDL
jgi:hypothetical protein